jgi:hypothetical protein
MGLDSRHDILNDIWSCCFKMATVIRILSVKREPFALVAEASLAARDRTTQSPLSPVIGRFHPWYKGKAKQCRPKLQEIAVKGLGPGVSTGDSPVQQLRPAELASETVYHVIGAPAVAVQNSGKSSTDKFHSGLAASGAGYQEHRHRSGYLPP